MSDRSEWFVRVPGTTARVIDLDGESQDTVELTVRMGRAAFELLTTGRIRATEIWLTKQPDGTYAIGVVTPQHPHDLGYTPQLVETDDRNERTS